MSTRIFSKKKERIVLLVLFFIINGCVIYFYVLYMQENIKTAEWAKSRCFSELTSTKYQLNVVTEYKNKVDIMLADTQKSHESDKDKFKDVLESCINIKQQSSICQHQFEDLKVECKKSKQTCIEQNKQYHLLKDHISMMEQKNERLQSEVLELIDKVDDLRKENSKLTNNLHLQDKEDKFGSPLKTFLDRSFSKQEEEADGVYKIDIHSGVDIDQVFPKKIDAASTPNSNISKINLI